MNRFRRGLRHCELSLCGLVLFAGCGSTAPIHYYQLSAIPYSETEETSVRADKGAVVGIGPVDIASYVDRAHLVIRAGATELALLESSRWAEPLQQNLTRVLIDNLSQALVNDGATVVRWDDGILLDYRVRIEFTKFDFSKTGEVSLVARWVISGQDSQEALTIKTSRFHSVGIPGDYGFLVSEMSGHVESLSQEISRTLSDNF